jgi:D-tagatose-1,6-bisphosphate aldolase subunit GatZ/KbaZ
VIAAAKAAVQEPVELLIKNLSRETIPLTLISQYFPEGYERIRAGEISEGPLELIEQHIRKVLRFYSVACGTTELAVEADG